MSDKINAHLISTNEIRLNGAFNHDVLNVKTEAFQGAAEFSRISRRA